MSRPQLSASQVDGLSYEKLHETAVELESQNGASQPPTYWFDLALRSAEAARNAERRGSKPGQYVAYTRVAIAYQKCMFHKRLKEARAADHAFSVRVNDFKATYEVAMRKAKVLKEELKAAPVKTHQSTNSVDHEPGGSIADRMKALSGRGVDVSTKRISRDLANPPQGASRRPQQDPVHQRRPSQDPINQRRPSQDPVHQRRPSIPRPPSISQLSLSRRGSAASLSGVNGLSPNPTGGSSRSSQSPAKNSVPLHRPPSAMSSGSARQGQASGSLPPSPGVSAAPPLSPSEPPPPLSQPPTITSTQPSPSDPMFREPDKKHGLPSLSAPSRPPHQLPTPPTPVSRTTSPTDPATQLDNFEKAFPSLDELGKQFDEDGFAIPALPASTVPRPLPDVPEKTDDDAAALFNFPSLPSVPSDLPGTRTLPKPPLPPPPPPPRLDDLKKDEESKRVERPPSPPSPDFRRQDRPASTLGFNATQDLLAFSPYNTPHASIIDEGAKLKAAPPPPPQQDDLYPPSPAASTHSLGAATSPPTANGFAAMPPLPPVEAGITSPPAHTTSPEPLAMPVPVTAPLTMPVPAPLRAGGVGNGPDPGPAGAAPAAAFAPPAPDAPTKPNFPFTNSITPDTLRSYFMNPAVDVLICDVRPSEEFATGFVGTEYHERGCKVTVVWIDPTVLMRPGLTSTQLENALSISPEVQQLAFARRNLFDLVVIVDSRSKMFPGKGEPHTPAGNLQDVIYEHEFSKTLPRSPALLVGGYDGWLGFIKTRQQINMQRYQQAQAAQLQNGPPVQNGPANGHSSPLSPRPANAPPPVPERRHAREKSYHAPPSQYSKEITENFTHGSPQSMSSIRHQHQHSASFSGGPASYTPYQQAPAPAARAQLPRASHASSTSISSNYGAVQGYGRPSHGRTDSFSNYSASTGIAPPPRASVHASTMTRRQSSNDYMDYGAPRQQTRIEYPQAHGLVRVPQPPPAAASHGFERQDQRVPMRLPQRLENLSETGVLYWRDTKLGLTGLKNLGNTCYMNSTVQCLSATYPFARFFLNGAYKHDLNMTSNLGTKGRMAKAFADLLKGLWGEGWQYLEPITFRQSIISFNDLFAGNQQHDSQEFLSFVLDGLHEDLNRVKQKPQIEMTPERERQLETLPPHIASDKEWALYRQRDDSFIVDLFQGQYMSRTTCLTCRKTSTVYDSFMWLTLDLPTQKSRVMLPELIDRWVRAETLSVEDGWVCTNCKAPRKASKALTLVRLPPVLLIQLKRFSYERGFCNRSDTPVIFPTNNLDLTRFVPRREPTGSENLDDPRTQIGPFKYDLYGVTNHTGTLMSGHYTAFVRDAGRWKFAEDSRISDATERDVVSHPAASYILFYKRVPAS